MATPVYPKALSGWTDRVNNVDTVWAADPNTLAAEIVAIESAVGIMPQVEPYPPIGKPITYSSMSARLSAAGASANQPYCLLHANTFKLGYGTVHGWGKYNTFSVENDQYKMFNGSDITIKARGLYLILAGQTWHPATNGYVQLCISINGGVDAVSVFNWASMPTARNAFHTYAGRYASTDAVWFGDLNVGDRVRVISENSTHVNPITVQAATLRAYYLRSTAQVTAGPNAYPV